MTSHRLDEDLELWEQGELSLEALEARHPGEHARGLADVHGRLVALAEEPVPDLERSWEELRGRLPSLDATASGRRRGAPRRLLIALAATLLVGGTAYASSPGFWNDRVADIGAGIRELVEPETPPPPEPAGDEPVAGLPGPQDPGDPAPEGGANSDLGGDEPPEEERGGSGDENRGGSSNDDDPDPDDAPDPDDDADVDDSTGGDDEPDEDGRGSSDDDGRGSSDGDSSGGDDEPDDDESDG